MHEVQSKKVVWGGGRAPPADKSGAGTPSRASAPHYTGAVCGRVWRRTVVGSTSSGRSDGRADDVGSARDLVALAIPVVVGADHVEPLARHRLQLAVPPPHRHTHTDQSRARSIRIGQVWFLGSGVNLLSPFLPPSPPLPSSRFLAWGFLPPIPHGTVRKYGHLQKIGYFPLERRSKSIALKKTRRRRRRRSSLLTTPIRQSTSRGYLLQVNRL